MLLPLVQFEGVLDYLITLTLAIASFLLYCICYYTPAYSITATTATTTTATAASSSISTATIQSLLLLL